MQSVQTDSAHRHLQYAIIQDNGQDLQRTMCYKRTLMSAGLLINCSETTLYREIEELKIIISHVLTLSLPLNGSYIN